MILRTTALLAASALSFSLAACGGAAANATSGAPTTTAAGATSLDGKSYEVTLSMPGEAPQKDTLVFASGKFESTSCTQLGFPQWAEYESRPGAEGLEFHVVTHHPSGTTVDWKGTVKGGTLEGTATRTMNGKTGTGQFKGTPKS